MSEDISPYYRVAIQDFKRARKQAAIRQLLARLIGKSDELLAFDLVRQKLGEIETIERGLQEIPMDAIVGSVSRHDDYTRDFLPKKDSDQERWAQIKASVFNMRGMDPIDVFQIGEVYFVYDGNHRVSVARQLKAPTISAHVIEIKTKVPLARDDHLDGVIRKARYMEFLESTKLDASRPEANLWLTLSDQYKMFYEQIETHRRRLSVERGRHIPQEEAATHWYDQVYQPVVDIIREQGVLHDFPERTEADMYLLFVEHREELVRALGWQVNNEAVVADLVKEKAPPSHNIIEWFGLQLYKVLIPEEMRAGPLPGQWRKDRLAQRKDDSLFTDILVGVQQEKSKARALDQAVLVAKRENGHLYGLHVVPDVASDHSKAIGAIRADFKKQCREGGLRGEFTVEAGDVSQMMLRRAAWVDLVVLKLSRPPHESPLTPLSAGFNTLVQHCPRPLLVVPEGAHSPMDRALLAYDGSPKANEALFVAAYMASRWQISLTVLTVETDNTSQSNLEKARSYLNERGVEEATCLLGRKPVADTILATAEKRDINFLVMGAFGYRPLLHLVLGSTADRVIRECRQPILICK
jgi:nucleotide-binding universal stress UspA family protein